MPEQSQDEKRNEERRRWSVEQAVRAGTSPSAVPEIAKKIEDYVANSTVPARQPPTIV